MKKTLKTWASAILSIAILPYSFANDVTSALDASREVAEVKTLLAVDHPGVQLVLNSERESNGWITLSLVDSSGTTLAQQTSYLFFDGEINANSAEVRSQFKTELQDFVESTFTDSETAEIYEI